MTRPQTIMQNMFILLATRLRHSAHGLGRLLFGAADERLEHYLEQATDHADLKRRLQSWQASQRHAAMTRLIPQRH